MVPLWQLIAAACAVQAGILYFQTQVCDIDKTRGTQLFSGCSNLFALLNFVFCVALGWAAWSAYRGVTVPAMVS